MEIYRKTGKTSQFFSPRVELFRTWRPHRTFALEPTFRKKLKDSSGDIVEYLGDDKMWWVEAGTGGVSLWDKPVKIDGEEMFVIPDWIHPPQGLILSRDNWNNKREATHYTIHPLTDMRKFQFTQLLFQLELLSRPRLNPPRS